MAEVYDRWHLSRSRDDAEPCGEHSTKTRTVCASSYHGKGKRWQVRYRDADGVQRKENFAKKPPAEARKSEIENDLNKGQFIDRAAGRQTVRTVGESWRSSAIHRDRTGGRVESTLRLHIYPTFGSRGIASVRPADVRAWVKSQSERYKPSTVGSHFEVLSTVMRMAVIDGAIRVSPCKDVRLPEVRRGIVVAHPDAVRALIEAAPTRYQALVRLAATSGLRQGELLGLEVGAINELGEVEVGQQLVTPDKGAQHLAELKTPESYREVPLAPSTVAAVKAHAQGFPPVSIELEDRTDRLKPKVRAVRLLFTDDNGRPVRRSTWSRVWKRMHEEANRALAAAGSTVRVPEKLTLHGLRDFYASCLIADNQNVKTVQVRLGHSKPSVTLNKYTGLWPVGEDTTAAAMESVLGSVTRQPECAPVVPSGPARDHPQAA